PLESLECPGDDQRLARQRLIARSGAFRLRHVDAGIGQRPPRLSTDVAVKKTMQRRRDLRANAIDMLKLVQARVRQLFHRPKMHGQQLRRGAPDVADIQAREYAREWLGLAVVDRRQQIVNRLFTHALELEQLLALVLQRVEIGEPANEFRVYHLI